MQGKREQFSGFNRTLDAINNVFRKFSAFHDETGRLNVDGMNIISNDGSNKLNRSRKARVSYKVQRTINASLNAATSTRAVSSNPNFVTRQKIEIIFHQLYRLSRNCSKYRQQLYQYHEKYQPHQKQHQSEERFSRNAETDLVCRLLLEKKKSWKSPTRVLCDDSQLEHVARIDPWQNWVSHSTQPGLHE